MPSTREFYSELGLEDFVEQDLLPIHIYDE